MPESKPITAGVVGLGRIGWGHHARILSQNPAFKLTACVDPLEDRRKEAESTYRCATFADIKEFLASGLAELAVICTRSVDHCAHTLAALRAGLHVVVEKPMAMNTKEADRMMAAAKKARRVLTVNQSQRANGQMRFIREVMDSGILGDVFWMRFTRHSFMRRNDWQMLKKYGGGYMNNNGAHSIDFSLLLLDSPVQDVWATLKHTVGAGDGDDFMKVVLRGRNGRVIEVEESYACAFPQPAWLVCGTTGTLQIADKQAVIKYFDPKKVKPIAVVDAAPEGRRYGNDDVLPWEEKTVEVKPATPYPDFYENLAGAIRRRGKLLITPESVRKQLHVLELARKSAGWKM